MVETGIETLDIMPGPGQKEALAAIKKTEPDPTKTFADARREALKERVAAMPADRCEGCNAGDCSKPPRMPTDVEDLKKCCFQMREELLVMVGRLAGLIEDHPAMTARATTGRDPNNPTSHAWLAFRHLEDADMRLDKVVQMLEGGKSCYSR